MLNMNPNLKKLLLFCLSIALFNTAFSQAPTLAKVVPPSPNMQAFQKYGNIPVSNYTGLPNISIPLFTIKYRDISYPLSISYHASGIKVSEEASQVGLGWALNSNGSISRNVIGDDDFNGSVYFHGINNDIPNFSGGLRPRDRMSYGNTVMFSNDALPRGYPVNMASEFTNIPPYDFQPDQYNFNVNGHSGKFVLNRDYQAIIQKQEKLQISCTATGSTWKIIADDGFIYDFTIYETYHDESGDHKSAWYLTKVTSPVGNSINFNYTQVNRTVQSIGSWSETWDYYDPQVISGFTDQQYFSTYNTGHQSGSVPGKEYALVVLDNIDFNTGIVKFNYSDRDDLVGDKKLDSLTIFTKNASGTVSGTPLKTVSLTYGYFDHGNTDDDVGTGNANTAKRLKLLQVQQTGYYGGNRVSENPYTFNYNEANYLPSKGSFARDHWGYYNGITNTSTLVPSVIQLNSSDPITAYMGVAGPEREPNANLVGTYSLAGIQYPTGGSTEFQYEANDFDEQQSRVNDLSYFNKTFTVQSKSLVLNYDNHVGQVITPSDTVDISDEYMYVPDSFRPAANSTVSLNIVIRFSDDSNCALAYPFPTTDKVTFDFYDITGTTLLFHKDAFNFPTCSGGLTDNCSICDGLAFTYNMNNLTLPPAKYLLRVHVDPSYTSIQDIRFTFHYYTQTGSQNLNAVAGNANYSTGGGQRIKRIIDHDAANPANINVKKFNYHYFANKNNTGIKEYSYGRRMSHPVYTNFIFTYDTHVRHYGGLTTVAPALGTHMMRSADSNIPLDGSAGGAVVGYDRVEVLDGENGENGKTVYTYVNQPDYVFDYSMYYLPIQAPFASNVPEINNGSLLSDTVYKNVSGQFIRVKETTNNYYEAPAVQNDVYGLENRPQKAYHFEDEVLSYDLPVSTDAREIVTYLNMRSKFIYLGQTNEKVYDPLDNTNTNYTETNTVYNYDNLQHLQPTSIVTSNSRGEIVTSFNKYPLDYTISGTATDSTALGVQNLVAKNMVTPIIEKYVKKTNPDGSNARVTNAVFTSYKTTQPLPRILQATNSIAPIPNFSTASITASAATIDTRYKQYVIFDSYDSFGNILQQHKLNGAYSSYIWDYNSTLPIAEAINATPANIAYTSFEFDGTGNWEIGSPSRQNTTAAKTGKVFYNLNNGAISKGGLTAATTYVVSYWSNSKTALTIPGTMSGYPVNGVTAKGWTYHEHRVTGLTTVILSGADNIDEVRLHPVNAQMTTYTYDPLVGLTSSTDANNLTTYYEYDGLPRLLNVKDQNGNILKNYSYNFASLAATWTNIGVPQCVQGANGNTGEQQVLQKDTNPNSVTYNQSRWLSLNTNTNYCPIPLPPIIYVKMTVGSTSVSNGVTYNTMSFRTYSDANCTVLINAPAALTVNYSYVTSMSFADGRTPNPLVTTHNSTVVIAAGSSQGTSGSFQVSGCSGVGDKQVCYTPNTIVTLQAGTGYTPWTPDN
jgi:YD repeat-containing protein